ncbi:transcription elongation regulator [Schizosaccharomyces cryophilus OY26]|uniref:Transcription factor BYE1 n=1 Tax=Schizosaccharomyces cryophilus (strain OY26 / ATCC MYA-4695 / CBS 11777 / NBRC 106824 / NRRL Y48691) TaxID=653667 RepID=S9VX96_SCHCR|nr:transcription elongation regulator [Schizosaccharomyces cryophilus OY26]EPY50620.1 transcription elongation regulator [Schizosaccharomyces cryophilus OY26]
MSSTRKSMRKRRVTTKAAEGDLAIGDESESAVRCICGSQTDNGDVWVQCDGCDCWQHAGCVGLSEDTIPESYFCEKCRRPAESDHEIEQEESSSMKLQDPQPPTNRPAFDSYIEKEQANGPSGKIALKDEESTFVPQEREESPSSISSQSSSDSAPSPAGGTDSPNSTTGKRKTSSSSFSSYTPKRIKGSEQKLQTETASQEDINLSLSIEELKNPVRKSVAKAWVSVFETIIKKAEKEGVVGLQGMNTTALALELENTMFLELSYNADQSTNPNNRYREKFRALRFNLVDDKNPAFRARVLKQEIPFSKLVHMTSEEMANPDLKSLAETIRQQSTENTVLKQHTLGYRIRTMQNGEMIVQDDQNIDTNSSTILLPSKVTIPPPPEESIPPETNESPAISESKSASNSEEPSNDYIKKEDTSEIKQNVNVPSIVEIDDPSVLDIVEKESLVHNEHLSSPYSPKEEEEASEVENVPTKKKVLWKGKVKMASISEFSAEAILSSGHIDFKFLFEILSSTALIEGRISISSTLQYLRALQKSQSKSIVSVLFLPSNKRETDGFNVLYKYFLERNRYGVLRSKSASVKDAYIIPIPSGQDIPEVVTLLHDSKLPKNRESLSLLGIFVLNKTNAKGDAIEHMPSLGSSSTLLSSLPTTKPIATENEDILDNSLKRLLNVLSLEDIFLIRHVVENNPLIKANPNLAIDPKFMQKAILDEQSKFLR